MTNSPSLAAAGRPVAVSQALAAFALALACLQTLFELVFTLGGISVIFLYFTMGSVGFYIVASKFWDSMMSFTLIAIPMYVYMAMLLEKSGVAQDLYRMMHVWFGGMRGGLAIGTVAICAIFAAMSGISGAAVVTMGTIALPRMLERGYDKRLAVGAINCGGGWGILIPPSILMVLYALLTEVSVGRLFASGIGPGILLFVLVSIYIGVRAWLQPSLAPTIPPEERGALIFSAAQDQQPAQERRVPIDGRSQPRGLFTSALEQALSGPFRDEPASALLLRVRAIMQSGGSRDRKSVV